MNDAQKTVIVAEDEVLTRMLAAEVLSQAGYGVIEAAHADEALAILKAHGGQVHLLFTDLHMPGGISGLELAHIVRHHWPKVALVITSGEHVPDMSDLPAGGVFVAKPYDLEHVVAHVQTLTAP